MIKNYIHPEMGVEQRNMGGYFTAEEALTIEYKGREVLYICGYICLEYSCAGSGSWNFVQILGYLKEQKQNKNGETASEIEVIEDEGDREAVKRILSGKYPESRIEYTTGF